MAMPEPQESAENKYLGQRSHTRKALITKIIWKQNNYETDALPTRCRVI